MRAIQKYPRTRHLEGSRLQPGDHDLDAAPLEVLRGRHVVVEEKLDGANCGISVDEEGRLALQSRGHFLVGGARERHWDLFKRWAAARASEIAPLLAGGRVLYGEWLYAKHTVFYDRLPHYLLEFDILEPGSGFLSTERRRELLAGAPIRSVPVLWQGVVDQPARIPGLVGRSLYKSDAWRDALAGAARAAGLDPDRAGQETDPSDDGEGLYIKVEEGGRVVERYKWIRASFLTAVVDSGTHWAARPILPNQLAPGVDLMG
jgi:RNA ligase